MLREMTFRPQQVASPGIPLGARSVGHYQVPAFHKEPLITRHFVEVFWCIAGSGTLTYDTWRAKLSPGWVGIYMPGATHHTEALADGWEYRWWTMDGPLAVALMEGFGLGSGAFHVGEAPIALLDELKKILISGDDDAEITASVIAYRLLARIGRGHAPMGDDPVMGRVVRMIHWQFGDPGLSVAHLSRMVGLHRSALTRRFTEIYSVSPQEYLITLRIKNAISLLKESPLSVAEIATRCGFNDPSYMARVIQKKYHKTPREIRHSVKPGASGPDQTEPADGE